MIDIIGIQSVFHKQQNMEEMKEKAKENGIDVDKMASSMKEGYEKLEKNVKEGYEELEQEVEETYEDVKEMIDQKMKK